MNRSLNSRFASCLWIGLFLLAVYCVINNYSVQSFVGAWLSGLDQDRWVHLEEKLKGETDEQLYHKIYHGDPAVRGVAVQQLSKRNKKEWFDRYKKLLNDDRYEVRSIGRALLWTAAAEEGIVEKVLLNDITKYDPDKLDYQQIIGVMIKRKKSGVYPFIVKYAYHNGWKSAAPKYFEDLGDPRALEVLYELKKQAPQKNANLSIVEELALERLDKAIAALEAVDLGSGLYN